MKGQTALLIIDVQNAMFSYEDEKLYNEKQVLDHLVQLVVKARLSKMPIFFIQHTSLDPSDEFYEGTSTWGIHPALAPRADESIIQKTTWDSFHLTSLQVELQKLDIHNLIIAGMQTEFCLDTTCRRAFSMGYQNILVEDAHSTFNGKVFTASQIIQHHNAIIGGRFAILQSTRELVEHKMGR
jgi:nicotinamidase-related amidase